MYRDQVRDERQKSKEQKSKDQMESAHTSPKRRYGRKCATRQQQANRRNGDDEKTESDTCKVGRENMETIWVAPSCRDEQYLNTRRSKLTNGQIVKQIDMMKPEL